VAESDGWPVGLGAVTVITPDGGIVTVAVIVEVDLGLVVLERLESNPVLGGGNAPVELPVGPPVPGSQPLGFVPPNGTVEFGRGKGGADEPSVLVKGAVAALVAGVDVPTTGTGPVSDEDGIGLDKTDDRLDGPVVPKTGEEV
jgi:hypothetical protein